MHWLAGADSVLISVSLAVRAHRSFVSSYSEVQHLLGCCPWSHYSIELLLGIVHKCSWNYVGLRASIWSVCSRLSSLFDRWISVDIPSNVLLWHACQHLVLYVKRPLDLLRILSVANNDPAVHHIKVVVELWSTCWHGWSVLLLAALDLDRASAVQKYRIGVWIINDLHNSGLLLNLVLSEFHLLLLLSRSKLEVANFATLLFETSLDEELAKLLTLGLIHLIRHGLVELLASLRYWTGPNLNYLSSAPWALSPLLLLTRLQVCTSLACRSLRRSSSWSLSELRLRLSKVLECKFLLLAERLCLIEVDLPLLVWLIHSVLVLLDLRGHLVLLPVGVISTSRSPLLQRAWSCTPLASDNSAASDSTISLVDIFLTKYSYRLFSRFLLSWGLLNPSDVWVHPHYWMGMVFVQRGNLVSLVLNNLLLLDVVLWPSSLLLLRLLLVLVLLWIWSFALSLFCNRCLSRIDLPCCCLHNTLDCFRIINDKVINVVIVDNIGYLVCLLLIVICWCRLTLIWLLFLFWLLIDKLIISIVGSRRCLAWIDSVNCFSTLLRCLPRLSVRIWRHAVAVLASFCLNDLRDNVTFLSIVLIDVDVRDLVILRLSPIINAMFSLILLVKHVWSRPALLKLSMLVFFCALGLFYHSRNLCFNHLLPGSWCWSIISSIFLNVFNSSDLGQREWPWSKWFGNFSFWMMWVYFWNFFLPE